jgi:hypothetical protein
MFINTYMKHFREKNADKNLQMLQIRNDINPSATNKLRFFI